MNKHIKAYAQFNNKVNDFYNIMSGHKKDHDKLSWSSKEGQYNRFQQILYHIDINSKVLDFGCGLGDFIKFSGIKPENYIGIDINEGFINTCKERYPDYKFLIGDKYKGNIDYFIASGVFTVHTSDNYFYSIIDYYLQRVNIALVFNLFSNVKNIYKTEETPDSDELAYRGHDISKIRDKWENAKVYKMNKLERLIKIENDYIKL